MSFLGFGPQGSVRARSKSRTRKDDNADQYQMSGALPQGYIAQPGNYTTVQPASTNAFDGVQFAKPLVPTFTSTTGASQNYPGAPAGQYQYAKAPKAVKYTAKAVIPPSKITPIADIVSGKKSKKKVEESSDDEVPGVASVYQTMTIEPGKPSKKSTKRTSSITQMCDYDRFSRVPSPPFPSDPDEYINPGRVSIMTPGSYPVDAEPRHPYGNDIIVRDVAPPIKSKSSKSRLSAGLGSDLRAPSPGRGRSGRSSGDSNLPPPSPMLESYRGTYQSMPGLPSPMIRGRSDYDDFDIEELEPLDAPKKSKVKAKSTLTVQKINGRSSSRARSRSRARSSSPKKSLSMLEAEQDAKMISGELIRSKPDFRVLTDVLPGLSHDRMMELHIAYKNVAKYQGKGINIAKHIKLKVPGHLRTIAYVTALGRWESEGYWANYWYQSAVSKRELLIESLMGRSNHDMHMIKQHFRDKRYADSLIKCMDKELKADKFRSAAMAALEASRQEENEIFPAEYVEKDVDTWARALKGRSGGETAMLDICVTRSDLHLKKCLRLYEREHGGNFAKLALARSENLVGEVLAHILNGVINRPARDAMLLHHALLDLRPRTRRDSDASSDRGKAKKKEKDDRKDRYELLISRVVRFHWDKDYMEHVKDEYRDKFDAHVEDDVEDWLKEGEFREFVLELLHT